MDLFKLEQKILKNWREIDAFRESVNRRPKNRNFVFYEGPPSANGTPGLHHVLARSFKDAVCRYKAMRGFRVERRAGWDTHGLPIELEVEKELGINSKKEIEKYGIAKFNKKCREAVWRYKADWENLTERMGFWINMENPYITYDPLYMESLWGIIAQAHEKELLYEGYKVVPYCPRCGTAVSSHEVAQGYKDVTETSVFVKFKIKKSPPSLKLRRASQNVYILAWTTTPWTLPGNVALAVGADIKYSLVKQDIPSAGSTSSLQAEYYILATDRLEILEGDYETLKEFSGKELVGIEYEPLFDIKELKSDTSYKVYAADFVSTEEGAGIVHTAVMYGEDDYELGDKVGLPKKHTVDEAGKFNELVPEFKGQFVKSAEVAIVDRLKAKGQLYKTLKYKHSYPFCWRCDTHLLYYATNSWFVKMSELRDNLIKANQKINWVPDYIKEGRFGQWLKELKDWAFSRSRYWGTPLPAWRCNKCEHIKLVGSRSDLAKATKGKNEYWFMRHGYSVNNGKDILISNPATKNPLDKLSPKGIKQVEASIKKLKKEGGVDLVITSPLGRTTETAKMVGYALGAKVITEDLLKEINVGIYENKTDKEYTEYFEGFRDYDFTKGAPKAETPAQVRTRMLKAINKIEDKYSGKKILIISHGHPLWFLETAMLGLTIQEALDWREKNYPQQAELKKIDYARFPYNTEGELDFHRPFVDEIEFPCSSCKGGTMKRVEDLVDVWFDSGAMPFAANESFATQIQNLKFKIQNLPNYPADYIAEGIDQTRGWFYTLLAVSGILDNAPSFKNVISLGHLLDEKGQKMSKSKGNVVKPLELADKYGMDAVRWYFFTINNPGAVKRFSERDVRERWHKFIGTFLNSYAFLSTYAPNVKAQKSFSKSASENVLDKWIVAKLKKLAGEVAEHMDDYDILSATRKIDEFTLEDLSNWYVRRVRPRLQRPKSAKEKNEAARTLSFVLSELAKLCAPFVPFISEYVWQSVNKTAKYSVHWEDFPKYAKLTKSEEKLLQEMASARQLAQAGLSLRAENSLKVRQPLESFALGKKISKEYKNILQDELNVKEIVQISAVKNKNEWAFSKDNKVALKTKISTALETEGQAREMMRNIQRLRKQLDLKPQDKISVWYSLPPELNGKLQGWEKQIGVETNAKEVLEKSIEGKKHNAIVEYNWDAKRKVKITIYKI